MLSMMLTSIQALKVSEPNGLMRPPEEWIHLMVSLGDARGCEKVRWTISRKDTYIINYLSL